MNDDSLQSVRRVGPTAWAVLELLRHRSTTDDGPAIAPVTIRTLAVDLGLAKNTVHRAIRRLRVAGLIQPHQSRSSVGTFTAGHYELLGDSTTDETIPVDDDEQLIQLAPTTATSAPSGQLTLGI